MKYEVAPNIYQISVPLPGNPLKNLNAYLVRGEQNLLIDTGFRTEVCKSALLDAMAEIGVTMENTDIFLTHLHTDHTGLAPELASANTKIFLSGYDRTRLPGKYCNLNWQQSDSFYVSHGFPREVLARVATENPARSYTPLPYDDYILIEDGDRFSYGGYDLTAVASPGHTPGHMCLYAEEEKILFLGDHVLFDITPNICAWYGFPNALGAYQESLKKFSLLEVRLPLPAHRTVQTNYYDRIEEILQHHQRRCDEILTILHETPGLTAYDLTGKMTWQIRCRNWDEFPVAQKWFAVGECIAHLDDLAARDLVVQERHDGLKRYFCK